MQQQLNVIYDLHTSPPLSLSPIILGCEDSLIMHSAGKSIPVFAGTLYKITGIGELSATCQTVWNKKPFIYATAASDKVYYTIY